MYNHAMRNTYMRYADLKIPKPLELIGSQHKLKKLLKPKDTTA